MQIGKSGERGCSSVCWNEKPKTAVFVDITGMILQSVKPNLQNSLSNLAQATHK